MRVNVDDKKPESIEEILTVTYRNRYVESQKLSFKVLWDVVASKDSMKKQLSSGLIDTSQFRNLLSSFLGKEDLKIRSAARAWSQLLKSRIAVFKFWSTLLSSFITLYGFGMSFFSLAGDVFSNKPATWFFIGIFLLFSIILLTVRARIEKHVFWYEYLCTHFDAIDKR
jgi:hypothetical protein